MSDSYDRLKAQKDAIIAKERAAYAALERQRIRVAVRKLPRGWQGGIQTIWLSDVERILEAPDGTG